VIDLTDVPGVVTAAIREHTTGSARSQQSDQRLLGPSEIGACRAYIAHTIAGTDRLEEDGIKLAAYVGEAVGELTERAVLDYLAAHDVDAQRQVPLTATLPGGLQISGSADLVIGPSVWDVKTKDGLAEVRRKGADFKHIAQINTYQLARIQQGLATPEDKWSLLYIDRSGADEDIVVISSPYLPEITEELMSRLEDALYAAEHDMGSAHRDEPYPFCARYCPFFHACRGSDEHQSGGLITEPVYLDAVAQYKEGKALEKEGKALAKAAQTRLAGVEGSTGQATVTWTTVPETYISGFTRASYTRLDVRPVRQPKKKKTTA
jgi:hypothetical protein